MNEILIKLEYYYFSHPFQAPFRSSDFSAHNKHTLFFFFFSNYNYNTIDIKEDYASILGRILLS